MQVANTAKKIHMYACNEPGSLDTDSPSIAHEANSTSVAHVTQAACTCAILHILYISLPAIFASSLLTCSPFFASKLRISSLDDRALTYSKKMEKKNVLNRLNIFVRTQK